MIDNNEKKPSKKPLIFYYVIVLLVLMLFNAILFPALFQTRVKEVGYSEFLKMVDSGKVTEVAIEEDNNQIIFVAEEDGKTKFYKTGIFPDDGLRERQERLDTRCRWIRASIS